MMAAVTTGSMVVLVFVLMFVAGLVVVVMVVVRQAISDSATGRTTQASPDGTARRAADTAPYNLTACSAQATTNGGFGFFAILRTDRATCGATDASADRSAGAAANGLPDHATQRATQAATDGGIRRFSGKGPLCCNDRECQYREYLSHFVNLIRCTGFESVRCEKCGQRVFRGS